MKYKVYIITCLVNGRVYIGYTSMSLEKRWRQHLADSRRRLYYFARVVSKHGPENFHVEVLSEYESPADALAAEQYYIAHFKSNLRKYGFNCTQGGETPLGYRHNAKAKKRIAEKMTGRSPWNKGRCGSMSPHTEHLKKTWYIESPDGTMSIVIGLMGFCRKNFLSVHAMSSIVNKNSLTHRGYRIWEEDMVPDPVPPRYMGNAGKKDTRSRKYEIRRPGLDPEVVENLSEYCRTNNINSAMLRKVSMGLRTSYKGIECRRLS